jgi:hypothetical protein
MAYYEHELWTTQGRYEPSYSNEKRRGSRVLASDTSFETVTESDNKNRNGEVKRPETETSERPETSTSSNPSRVSGVGIGNEIRRITLMFSYIVLDKQTNVSDVTVL